MKYTLIVLILLMQAVAHGDDSLSITGEEKKALQKTNSVVETSVDPDEIAEYSLQWSNHLLDGSMYLGKDKADAQLNSFSLEFFAKKEGIIGQIGFDHIYNQGNVRIYNLGGALGVYHQIGRFDLNLYGGLSVSNYQEKSNMQNINTTSAGLQATAALNYFVTQHFYVNLNYKFYHLMYTNGLKYWGEDPRKDVVYDLHGLGFGLGWRF